MKNRKRNRMKGFDYSSNNLYFVTNCVKNNKCCLGNVIHVGTGRDLSVHHPENHHPENHHPENHHLENHHPENHHPKNHNPENHHLENHHLENHHLENHHPKNHYPENHHSENHHPENHHSEKKYKVDLNQYGLIVEEKIHWLEQQYSYVVIHNYVVMPNHFHIILEIDSKKVADKEVKIKSLSSLLGAMKTTSSNLIHKTGFDNFSWHRSFHDHIIRNEREYVFISNYIDMNPQKWFEDRFYSGQLKQL